MAQGCSTYSMGTSPAARSSSWMAVTAWSTSHAPLASRRIQRSRLTVRVRASATASTRAQSSLRVDPGSATFTFAVAQPWDSSTRAAAASGLSTGTVTLTGTLLRRVKGMGTVASLMAASIHRADSSGP